MKKNLVDHSDSFAHRDDETNARDNPHSPLADPRGVDLKPDDETTIVSVTGIQGGHNEEKKEEEAEAIEVLSETPPLGLEKVSEDIDQFLVTLQQRLDNVDSTEASIEIPNLMDKFLDLVEEKVAKYDKIDEGEGEGKAKWGKLAEEDLQLLEAMGRISTLLKMLCQWQPRSKDEINQRKDSLVNRIGLVQLRVMLYLEEEFRLLMEESQNPCDSEIDGNLDHKGKHVVESDDCCPTQEPKPKESGLGFPGYPKEAIANFNKIATAMISSGYQPECYQVYTISRRHAFEESLQNLGFEKISIDEIQKMQWEALESEISTWINTFKVCTSEYFPSEQKLGESVFSEQSLVAAGIFSNHFRQVVVPLLNFAESVAMTKRAGEKLFKLLDMYEALRDVILALDNLFQEDCVGEFKTETTLAKCRLGEAAISTFCDLENSIRSDTGKTPVLGGAVHPLTRYIMNYLRLACEYKDTMEEVFREHSKIERADSTSRPHYEGEGSNGAGTGEKDKENASPFAVQLMRVMELLDSNLEGKAKLYKEVALSCIFMMNNGRYIVQKIKGSTEIYEVMGEQWCRKRSTELRTYHKNYQVESWSKILGCLNPKDLIVNGKVQKPVLKERFKSFNALFDEIHKTQSLWVVSDEQLQSELRVSISALVIPAYRSFLGRFSQTLYPGRQTEKYIKYQPEDIETYINELFDGNAHQSGAKKKA